MTPTPSDPPVVVIGAGTAGLGAALALSRDGHRVLVLERDATPLPATADEAFGWDRPGAPQVRHSHAFLALLRNLLRDDYPDLLAALLDAGATELRFCDDMPPDIDDPSPKPGDEDLVALACRRTTFEWVLRRKVLESPLVELHDGTAVAGLEWATGPEGLPLAVGVRLTAPDRRARGETTLPAAFVVVANGRRATVPEWFAEGGATVDEETQDTGIVYFSRFYRLRDTRPWPADATPVAGDLGYLKYAVFPGDNGTYSVTLACATSDRPLRSQLAAPAGFVAAAGAVPLTEPWVDEAAADPMTPVHAMAGLVTRRRDFLRSGRPVALGAHAVGDAHTCTNPLYGRGCALGMRQASLLAAAVRDHPDDALARATAYEEASERHIAPWWRAAVAQDRHSRDSHDDTRDAPQDAPGSSDDTLDPRDFLRSLLREGLMPAVRTDAVVYRAFVRSLNLLTPPDAVISDPDVVGRVMAVWERRDEREEEPPLGPSREEMVARLS